MNTRTRVEQALKDAKTLPAAPMVMAKIGELCQDPKASARDLGKLLQLDSSLTTRVLKQVNSAFYGLSATIKTVTHAVVILGFQEIKHVAMSVPVANIFEEHFDEPGIDVQALWERSLAAACLGRTFSYHLKHPVPEQIFVSGIIADIGMVILNGILGEDYAAVVAACPDDAFLPEVEEQELGISHLEVGARLTRKWRFPAELVQVIETHHDPVIGGEVLLEPGLVYLGRRLARSLLAHESPAPLLADLPPELVAEFGLSARILETSADKAARDLEAAKQMLKAD